MQHIVLTRFNIASPGREAAIRNAPGWLSERFDLFEQYCLPSVAAQSMPPDHWLIYFDEGTPDHFKARIETLRETMRFTPRFVGLFDNQIAIDDVNERVGEAGGLVVTTRLDNDDAIASDFFATIRDAARDAPHGTVLNFPNGLAARKGRVFSARDTSNPFTSLVERGQARVETIWSAQHASLGEKFALRQIETAPQWLQVVHNGNVTNRIKGSRVSPDIASRDFALQADAFRPLALPAKVVDRTVFSPLRRIREAAIGAIKPIYHRVRGGDAAPRPRKVLIIVENLPVPFDRRVWLEARTLRDAGYVVSIICPTGKGFEQRYEMLEGIAVYRHRLPVEAEGPMGYVLEYGAALFWQLTLAVRVSATRGFDVIHACNPPDLIFLVAAPFRLFGKRFVFDHHDLCPELFETKFGGKGLLYKGLLLVERATFGLARISIATNESYKAIAVARGGMDPEKVFVVRSGPELSKIKPGPPVPAMKQGKRFLVGYVGVIGRQEGLDLLIDAAVHLKAQGRDDVHYGIVGGGPELEAIKAYAQERAVADLFTFTGRAPDDVMMAMLNTADICVNPDRVDPMNDLSTMNKIMEYMALGKPIVQFEVKEGRFSAGESSLYAKPNDIRDLARQIETLLDDSDLRQRMGAFGFERVHQHLGWDKEAPKLLAAYEAVFQK